MLYTKNLSFSYGRKQIINDISMTIKKGELTSIIGPNGSGKTTLLYLLTKFLEASQGEIFIDDKPLKKYSVKELSQKVTVVSQNVDIRFPFTCLEIVMMGRTPYSSRSRTLSNEDMDIVYKSMELTQTLEFKDSLVTEISGGEKQRVMLAKALAQTPKVLFLDEAFSNMDIDYKIKSLNLMKKLNEEQGTTVVSIMHDINLVNIFSDEIIAMKKGNLVYSGKPDEVLTPDKIKTIFGINTKRTSNGELLILANI